ncbi:hypothetical protein GCK72_004027 [Caenorhabditis remanei]|uniref:Calpain catalytic domain-containing protein n=1 Tax=Caenorhabditis remanei TaxID=31234 RepID=A0A6A5HB28_CAERE|nr:hypothetical protein GCK72_004027 [Caenorhabditis remanei]KAF1764081.1 hypothetical protein GCK72_004027 [Caenorhabditis remanei]
MTSCAIIKSREDQQLEDCVKWVNLFLKDFNETDVFYDSGFLDFSDEKSLAWDMHGTMINYEKIRSVGVCVYHDPWPFHAQQGNLRDCWLIAAMMTIPRRRKLMEWILPENEFSLKHGLFFVRLYIKNAWTVYVVDGHFPRQESKSRSEFARLTRKELWPALIEKAVAKVLGGYHMLNGGKTMTAFKCLTGDSCCWYELDKETNLNLLWRRLQQFQSSGYLMTISTPKVPDRTRFDEKNLGTGHGYSILDTGIHEGHRLVLIGSTNNRKWNGKWSELPAYNEEVTKTWNESRMKKVNRRFFWMEIDDVCEWFNGLTVCKFREGWNELRTGRCRWKDRKQERAIRIRIKERIRMTVKLIVDYGSEDTKYIGIGLINIHTINKNNIPESIVFSHSVVMTFFEKQGQEIEESDPFYLETGEYLIVFNNLFDTCVFDYELILRSPTPMNNISYEYLTFENDEASDRSFQRMITDGARPPIELRNGLFLQEYSKGNLLILIAKNHTKESINMSLIAKPDFKAIITIRMNIDNCLARDKTLMPAKYLKIRPKRLYILGVMWSFSMSLENESRLSCLYCVRTQEEKIKNDKETNKKRVIEYWKQKEELVGAKKQKTSGDSEDIEDPPRPEGSNEFSDEWLKDIEEYDGFEDSEYSEADDQPRNGNCDLIARFEEWMRDNQDKEIEEYEGYQDLVAIFKFYK